MNNRWIAGLMGSALIWGAGCSSMYYGAMESVGIAKRDLMVSRVEGARDSQQAAKKEFANALDQFKSVVETPGGDLEAKYKKLHSALQKSESRAADIHERIASVESVSQALFKEWKAELKQYENEQLRRSSEAQLKASQTRYKTLIAAMKKAESRLEPALQPLRDQVLYLKHNLNAQAIGALTEEVAAIETRVDDLVRDMEAAIQEADAFIATLNKG
jgi:hypothetical protein